MEGLPRAGRSAACLIVVLAGLGPVPVFAECSVVQPPPPTETESPAHHPVGRGLPRRPDFAQPEGCTDTFWFFDQNHDGLPDEAEPRLYGPERTVVCGSCHTSAPPGEGGVAFEVFLRQEPQRLCLVCHSL